MVMMPSILSVQERTDKMIAQALQEKETDMANHEEEKEFQKLQVNSCLN
jgi:hypothetical protein